MPVHPLPLLADGREPLVSDGWRQRSSGKFHYGLDIMYRKESSDSPVTKVTTSPSGRWWMPDGVPALACMSGKVIKSEWISTGEYVYIDHGNGWRSQLMHGKRGSRRVSVGESVSEGQPLFTVGYNAKGGGEQLAHLHFQLRKNGTLVNPQAIVEGWRVISNPGEADPMWLLMAGLAAYVALG